MGSKPFKVSDAPAKNVNEKKSAAAPPAGSPVAKSTQKGDPLPPASKDKPDHEPLIPWPAAKPVEHKPFKNTK